MILGLLLAPSVASASSSIEVVSRTGDGVWIGDTWQVQIFPGGEKATTLRLYNSSSSSLAVEVTVSPSSLDNGNLTFELDKSSFTIPGKSYTNITLSVKASKSATPGTYTTELKIKSEVPPPPPEAPSTPDIVTNLFGTAGSFNIGADGRVQQTISATSQDGKLTLTIPVGTIALDKNGNPLSSLTAAVNASPPAPPQGANIIGLAYDFAPDGATFSPPITITFTYDPTKIPAGVNEKDLVIAYYDKATGKWVKLENCTVDLVNHTITAPVSHYTAFTVLAYLRPATFTVSTLSISPTEVNIGERVAISAVVTNTGGLTGSYKVTLKIDNVVVETKTLTLASGASQTVTFTTSKDVDGTYTVDVNGLSGTFIVKAVEVPARPAAFTTSALTVSPIEVDIGESVAISILVTNTGDLTGSYEVTLKIDNVVETKTVTLAGGASQTVTFTTSEDVAGTYTVNVNGLSGTFTVKTPPVPVKPINWWLIGGIIAGVVVIGLLVFFWMRSRAA